MDVTEGNICDPSSSSQVLTVDVLYTPGLGRLARYSGHVRVCLFVVIPPLLPVLIP